MIHKHISFENAARALGGHSRTTRSVIAPLTGAISATAHIPAGSNAGSILSGATGGSLSGNVGVVQGIQHLASILGQTTTSQQATVNGLLENTRALTQNTVAVETQKNSALSAAGRVASSFLGGGFGISPLLSGLFSLLGAGSQPQSVVQQIRYAAPPSVSLSGAIGSATSSGGGSQAVNIQVHAMDSKSFIDHSEEIAQAVRHAILHSSNLNDVITNL